jgi:thioredoxin reductase (NADPH)
VAIQAGLLLANRLFGQSNEAMDYEKVCTTVFTPLEYSCVGLSEEFLPLEWSLSNSRHHHNSFAKAVVEKTSGSILGLHFVGPNAGEVMQGYGVAIKKGLTYKELISTVGIHPTSAEELVTLSVTKSSGEDAAAGGC